MKTRNLKIIFCALAAAATLPLLAEPAKVAVFVQNRAKLAGLDDEVDGVRDRLTASLAEVENLEVVDAAQVADAFRRYKVMTAEERAGLIGGVFSGGSVSRMAEMLGCDYIIAASIVNASTMKRNVSGRLSTVYTLRMTLKVTDATGASVDGMPVWVRQLPVLDAVDEDVTYFQPLFDQWSTEATAIVAQKSPKWRKPARPESAEVEFFVSTTIDKTVAELESQTKGTNGEMLQELRRVVGGVTVELDGAIIGSSPGPFKATPGLHQIRVTRQWMVPFEGTVNIRQGTTLDIALEMSPEGVAQWGTTEVMRADLAKRYADAAMTRGVKVNIDTANWRDVGGGIDKKIVIENGQ